MINALYQPLSELEEFGQIQRVMKYKKGMALISGCIDSQKSHLIACLAQSYPVRLIIAPDELRAKEIYENYQVFDPNILYYPARDILFFQADLQSRHLTTQRVRVMKALAEVSSNAGQALASDGVAAAENFIPVTVVLTMSALMTHCMSAKLWTDAIRSYAPEDEISLAQEQKALLEMGYERVSQVEQPGQYASRGDILDIYPLTEENPVRIELWGDEIDSIRQFDAKTQRTREQLGRVFLYPASEFVTTPSVTARGLEKVEKEAARQEKKFRAENLSEEAFRVRSIAEDAREKLTDLGDTTVMDGLCDYFYPDAVSLLDYFPEGTPVFIDEPVRTEEGAREAEAEFQDSISHRLEKGYVLPGQSKLLFPVRQIAERLAHESLAGLMMQSGAKPSYPVTGRFDLSVSGTGVYNGNFELLLRDLARYKKNRWRVVLLCASRTRGKRLADDLTDHEVTAFYSEDPMRVLQRGEIMVTYGSTHRGYEYPLLKFAVLSESDLFGREKKRGRRKKKEYSGKNISGFTELSPGDYVVHENHGIGIYKGVEKVTVDGVQKDYMKLEYAGGATLYVLATQLDMIQKYADADARKPKISRLGGQEWTHTKSRVRTAVEEVAQELVDLYAVRQNKKGYAYGPDTTWQTEFEELFPFEETEDQLQAIADTKKDMESSRIMDRLICGDVGYGKTEIAIRAAFKAVQENKQVAILAPTTILAQQHYNTFVQRMKDYPVRIELLCRFRSRAEQTQTVRNLENGIADIVIGTHRLLSKDVKFKNLGLLVVDEEQRFGVTHKEKIKQMRRDVDVLTLTATPIPRTLNMSLIGIRDMSVLEEAPQDRLPIQTFVMEYSEETVREALSRELARGGQAYIVYNHISTISDMTARVQSLVPEARVAYAHGKMTSNQVEDIMYDFINGDIDVLVTTTIIETGLDISNVNTMIICDADRMGLSQLYQLRGRVGRSSRTSYAFLMYKRDRMLRETAEKRLGAIREYTELGSGFKIAMRDLEIRGAGNMLGKAQSGHMAQVGYDLYCKLLNASVMKLKGESAAGEEFETSIDLSIDAYIPEHYVENESLKLDLYKRIASISAEAEYEDMLDELMDRFGELPRSVQDLLKVALLKARAHDCYITDLSQKGDELRFTFYSKAPLDADAVAAYLKRYNGRMRFVVSKEPYFAYSLVRRGGKTENLLETTGSLLADMQEALFPANPASEPDSAGGPLIDAGTQVR